MFADRDAFITHKHVPRLRKSGEFLWERDKINEHNKAEKSSIQTGKRPRPPLQTGNRPQPRGSVPRPPLESGSPSLCCDFRRFKGGTGGRFPVCMLDVSPFSFILSRSLWKSWDVFLDRTPRPQVMLEATVHLGMLASPFPRASGDLPRGGFCRRSQYSPSCS